MAIDKIVVQKKDKINPVEMVIGISLAIVAIIIFNIFPESLGLAPEEETWFPLLDPAFAVHVPWLTASWGMEIALKLMVLVEGRWRWFTRLLEFLVSIFGVYVAYRIVTGGPIVAFSPLDWPIRIGLWIAVVVGSITAAVQGVRLLIGRPAEAEDTAPSHPA